MANFVMESRTVAGSYLATLPFRNLQGEFFLSKPDQFRWELPLYHPSITRSTFFPGKTEMWLWRNGAKIFAGPLWDATANSGTKKITCAAEGLESYFDVRRISADTSLTGTLGDNAWALIAASQAMTDGNLFITQGTTTGAISGTYKYAKDEGLYIGNVITDLSDGGAFDWEITPARVFNIYTPRIGSRARVRLEYGGNVNNYSDQVMGKYEANDVLIKGPGTTVSQPTIDTVKRSEYGLRQFTDSNTAMKTQTLLNGYASRVLALRRDSREIPQIGVNTVGVNPLDGDITLGQISRLVINDGWVTYDQDMRMSGFQLTAGKHGEETFILYLSDLREIA